MNIHFLFILIYSNDFLRHVITYLFVGAPLCERYRNIEIGDHSLDPINILLRSLFLDFCIFGSYCSPAPTLQDGQEPKLMSLFVNENKNRCWHGNLR